MTIYGLLRFLIKTLAGLGPVKKKDAYDALSLIDQLERMSAFGEIGRITSGSHQFLPKNHYGLPETQCAICDEIEARHE